MTNLQNTIDAINGFNNSPDKLMLFVEKIGDKNALRLRQVGFLGRLWQWICIHLLCMQSPMVKVAKFIAQDATQIFPRIGSPESMPILRKMKTYDRHHPNKIAKEIKAIQSFVKSLEVTPALPQPMPEVEKSKVIPSQPLEAVPAKNLAQIVAVQPPLAPVVNPQPKPFLPVVTAQPVLPKKTIVLSNSASEKSTFSFSHQCWFKHLNTVCDDVPSLPNDIIAILSSECPFNKGKIIAETHMLAYIPKGITLTTLNEISKIPYTYCLADKYENLPSDKSRWILMTKKIVPGSEGKTYAEQQALVKEFSLKANVDYQIPTVLDATVCAITAFKKYGERLFGDDPQTYTRCQELVNGKPLVVGNFSTDGLCIYDFDLDDAIRGVAAVRVL